jgi:hypothetical protein
MGMRRAVDVVSDHVGYPAVAGAARDLCGTARRGRPRALGGLPGRRSEAARASFLPTALRRVLFNGSESAPLRTTFVPWLLPASAPANSSYNRSLSRRARAQANQADACRILIPSCRNSHARSEVTGAPPTRSHAGREHRTAPTVAGPGRPRHDGIPPASSPRDPMSRRLCQRYCPHGPWA